VVVSFCRADNTGGGEGGTHTAPQQVSTRAGRNRVCVRACVRVCVLLLLMCHSLNRGTLLARVAYYT
jgi:hypothetical protein